MSPPSSLRSASHSFTPRPFPPPALSNVPETYIVSQLHRLASNYWYRPETADCTIIVPCDMTRRISAQPPDPDPLTTGPFSDILTLTHSNRDGQPARNSRRMVLKLHQDYLSAQSMFMRALFSGSSPLDLTRSVASPTALSTSDTSTTSQSSSLPPLPQLAACVFPVHPSRRPRVLPSSSSHHPVIFLPLPDAISFPHLVHYAYFGRFDYIEECLHRGTITWGGIVRNVEYLGMRLELKASLGRYYRQWLRPNTLQEPRALEVPAADSDEESESSEGNDSEGSRASDPGELTGTDDSTPGRTPPSQPTR